MKKILTLAALLLMNLYGYAQIDPVRTELNSIFQNINKTQIPTGYLNEYGPEVVNKKWLTGALSDSNFIRDMNTFNFLYNDIENCRINFPAAPPSSLARVTQPIVQPLDSAKIMIDLARYDSLGILAFFTADYASLLEDALNLNLFTKVGNQIFDVANRTQSPYLLNHTFAAAPVLGESKFNNQIKLGFKELLYGNTSNVISSVQINFLDGAGYQNLFANNSITPLTKSYTDSSGFKKFAVKVTYTNGKIDECYTGQTVNVVQPLLGNILSRYEILSPQELLNPAHRIAPTTYLNINPTIPIAWLFNAPNASYTQAAISTQRLNQDMKIYIRYKTRAITDPLLNKIVKPFIVVEGYDITDASPLLKATNYDINKLLDEWQGIIKPPVNFDFNKELDDIAGYDLIFIDYYTMRSITENADYLLQAIDWINSNKQNNGNGVREQNVVMGISMGGLVSRYALAKRTKANTAIINPTETKQLITMDSPHQGANVPLGIQHFLYDFGDAKIVVKIKTVSDELRAFYYTNTLAATQQQLLLRVTGADGGRVNNTFLAENGIYRTMVDYNSPYPFYAISNGSQCANPVMQPNSLIIKKDGEVATANWLLFFYKNKYRLDVQVNSLPAYGIQSQISKVVMERNIKLFYGAIGTGWLTTYSETRTSPANTIPWDGVPGGTKPGRPISQTGINPDINIKTKDILSNVLNSLFYVIVNNVHSNVQIPFLQNDFTFVPITSALDIQNVTASTLSQPFNFALNGLQGSRANKFITQDFAAEGKFNIEHTNFTARNCRWLFNEMQNITQPAASCIDYCNSNQISGLSRFCISETYSVAPSSATIIWSATPSGIVQVTQNPNNSNIVTLTKLTDGVVTLIASGVCNSGNLTKSIIVGKGAPSATILSMNVFCEYTSHWTSYLNATCAEVPDAISYDWYAKDLTVSTNPYINLGYSNSTDFPLNAGNRNYSIRLVITTPCGTLVTEQIVFAPNCRNGGRIMVNPNPVTNVLNITAVKDVSQTENDAINEVIVTDKFGAILIQKKYTSGVINASIPITNLKADVYFVRTFDGKIWTTTTFIKN